MDFPGGSYGNESAATYPRLQGLKVCFAEDIALPCSRGKTSTSGDVWRRPRLAGSPEPLGCVHVQGDT